MWVWGRIGNTISIGDRKERMWTEDRATGRGSLGEEKDSSEMVAWLVALSVRSGAQGTALRLHSLLFGPTAVFRRTSDDRTGFRQP